jgi:hypothetical protein
MAARQGLPGSLGRPGSLAARVTYLLEPKNWLIVTVVGVGAHADGLAGVGWGLLAALFAAVLPTVFISYGIRRGRWEDRNVGDRRPRLVVLAFITASVATGLILLAVLGAPALLTGYLAFMLASVAVLAAITLVWKISIHCAVAAGSVTAAARRVPASRPARLVPGGGTGPHRPAGGGRQRARRGGGFSRLCVHRRLTVFAPASPPGARAAPAGVTQAWPRAAASSPVRPSSLATAIGFM